MGVSDWSLKELKKVPFSVIFPPLSPTFLNLILSAHLPPAPTNPTYSGYVP